MAVFDTDIGAISLFEYNRDRANFYIDNLYSNYFSYSKEEVKNRIEKIYFKLKDEKRLIVTDFDALGFLYEKQNVFYGEESMINNLKDKKVLVLASNNKKAHEFLKEKLGESLEIFNVEILINAARDLINPLIILKILDEYINRYSLEDEYEYIFLASSSLHLIKNLFYKRFKKSIVISNVDFILNDYYYIKENKLRDNFYVTGDKRDFYERAEKYLQKKEALSEKELLHVNTFVI